MKNKHEAAEAYPLSWPAGWPRTPAAKRDDGHRFRSGSPYSGQGTEQRYTGKKMVTFIRARTLLRKELDLLKATNVVLSTNARVRADGDVRADDAERRFEDPGIAVYFTLKGKQMVMAQDAFDSLAANARSIGLAIEAIRALERHGGGTMMERAFAGFSALPPPEGHVAPARPWRAVFAYSEEEGADVSLEEVEARYKRLAKKYHPDAQGGDDRAMSELNAARDSARVELGG